MLLTMSDLPHTTERVLPEGEIQKDLTVELARPEELDLDAEFMEFGRSLAEARIELVRIITLLQYIIRMRIREGSSSLNWESANTIITGAERILGRIIDTFGPKYGDIPQSLSDYCGGSSEYRYLDPIVPELGIDYLKGKIGFLIDLIDIASRYFREKTEIKKPSRRGALVKIGAMASAVAAKIGGLLHGHPTESSPRR